MRWKKALNSVYLTVQNAAIATCLKTSDTAPLAVVKKVWTTLRVVMPL
jgi:hypothetical protein